MATRETHAREEIAEIAAGIALEGFNGPGSEQFASNPLYIPLLKAGSTLWFDTGDKEAAEKVWADELRGLTTNNTLVNQVIQTGSMDEVIRSIAKGLKGAGGGLSAQGKLIEAAFILNAKLALSLVERFGCKVSVELHPDIAHNWEATVAFGKRYFAICPSHFIIKVPMTPEGFIAVRKLSQAGIPVNFTLGFSVRQNFFAAMFSQPAYVNIFLGRLGVIAKESGCGSGDGIGEKVTLASQEMLDELRAGQLSETRQIAASLRGGQQVKDLAGVDVQTIPPRVAAQYLEAAYPPDEIVRRRSADFDAGLSCGTQDQESFQALWTVTDAFRAFTQEAVQQGDSITSGQQILEIAEAHGVADFFRNWSQEEQAAIKADGKIPNYSKWKSLAAIDDQMSQAALQSFTEDQAALDRRIAGMLD